jgi:hypothetical protein
MTTSAGEIVPIQTVDTLEKVSWARLFLKADDAFLAQMAGKGQVVFIDSDGGQTPIVAETQDFIIVVLHEQVFDGYAIRPVPLPSIKPTNEVKR